VGYKRHSDLASSEFGTPLYSHVKMGEKSMSSFMAAAASVAKTIEGHIVSNVFIINEYNTPGLYII
jgi:hypothetical protein